jgi:hypothetical protein
MKLAHIASAAALTLLVSSMPSQAVEVDQQALKQEAVSIVKRFGGSLKPELKKALKAGGPAHAISVCSEKAPAIAHKLSTDTGWYIKRVSLKPRNPNAKPDAWEEKVLKMFDERQAKGEDPKKMAYAEVVDGKFRFMKAQGVEKVCLNCHAAKVKPEVEAKLKEKYPHDKARGYSLGQIRGAFSLARDL